MITITISPFGHMREFFNEPIKLTLKNNTQSALRAALLERFPEAGHIIELCAFSNETRVLAEREVLENDAKLSILPPVCGG